MKNIFKATLLLGLASSMALTGCIEEVEPTNGITQEQLDSSIKAGDAVMYAIPAHMVEYTDNSYSWHGWFGYPAMMQIRDRILDEMICAKSGTNYNQWSYFEQARFNDTYWMTQVIWLFYSGQVLTCNKALQIYPADVESEIGQGRRATALAYRTMLFLDMARWYEFLPNDKTSNINDDGNDVLNLTIPVVTEDMTEEEARNNPRKPHDEMFEFLLEDLKYCEENIGKSDFTDALFPNLAAVYGLYARLYMWDEQYDQAAVYARKAITESGKRPLTQDEWTDPKNGFNTLSNNSWIWGMQLNDETSAVQTGICNFTSMVSVETTFGYAGIGAGAYPSCGYSFYQRVKNNDFRKLSWCPPGTLSYATLLKNLQLNQYSTNTEKSNFCGRFTYGPVKFRPASGNCDEYSVACAVALPLMRVEEMYFIEMEAIAHSNPTEGKSMVEDFMNTYRWTSTSSKYSCSPTDIDGVVEEIVFQKRVEFWGEGLNFFDMKRLNYSVTRAYTNSNFYNDAKFNTDGRPAWFNLPFIISEGENNVALWKWNNPNVDGLYTAIKD